MTQTFVYLNDVCMCICYYIMECGDIHIYDFFCFRTIS